MVVHLAGQGKAAVLQNRSWRISHPRMLGDGRATFC
jgi:hypothetical protein